ncbi:hypothetical protein Anas_04219 [Armadillidium nasatum]|uniref:Uncharacterized protein n=1 Tax=Armadillidium nasatum TaxID=96803 RepID=A0A5N5SVT0_9CRUS|nr:hypothetical protein Anas_04219 [Armadillidium nasatum]
MITRRTLRSNTSKTNIVAACVQNDDKLTQKQEKISITKSIPNKKNSSDIILLEEKDRDNKKELIKKSNRTRRNKMSKEIDDTACLQNDDKLTVEWGKIRSYTKRKCKISSDTVSLEEKELENKEELIKNVSKTNAKKSKNLPVEKRSYKKASKGTTLKYLKERQKLHKENLNINKDSVEDFPLIKKNKALEELMKVTANETLTIKTPKFKNKQNTMGGITPRSVLISELGKELSTSNLITPKDTSKSKAKLKEDGALHVLYKHLDINKSRKRKRKSIMSSTNFSAKIAKASSDQTNLFKDVGEENIYNNYPSILMNSPVSVYTEEEHNDDT